MKVKKVGRISFCFNDIDRDIIYINIDMIKKILPSKSIVKIRRLSRLRHV